MKGLLWLCSCMNAFGGHSTSRSRNPIQLNPLSRARFTSMFRATSMGLPRDVNMLLPCGSWIVRAVFSAHSSVTSFPPLFGMHSAIFLSSDSISQAAGMCIPSLY